MKYLPTPRGQPRRRGEPEPATRCWRWLLLLLSLPACLPACLIHSCLLLPACYCLQEGIEALLRSEQGDLFLELVGASLLLPNLHTYYCHTCLPPCPLLPSCPPCVPACLPAHLPSCPSCPASLAGWLPACCCLPALSPCLLQPATACCPPPCVNSTFPLTFSLHPLQARRADALSLQPGRLADLSLLPPHAMRLCSTLPPTLSTAPLLLPPLPQGSATAAAAAASGLQPATAAATALGLCCCYCCCCCLRATSCRSCYSCSRGSR